MVLLTTPLLSAERKIQLNEYDCSFSNYRLKHIPSVTQRVSIYLLYHVMPSRLIYQAFFVYR